MTVDPEVATQAVRDLTALFEEHRHFDQGLSRLESASGDQALRDAALDLPLKHPAVRSIGLLIAVPDREREEILNALIVEDKMRDFALTTLKRVRTNEGVYRALCRVLPQSFRPPAAEEWQKYRDYLNSIPDEPIWGDALGVSIRKIYVPPRYTHEVQSEVDVRERYTAKREEELPVSADPEPLITTLLTENGGPPALTFILAPPGMGKSTFASILASHLALAGRGLPVLVRLRELDPSKRLLDEVRRIVKSGSFPGVAEHLTWAEPLVLILDGFDELAHATHSSMSDFFLRAKDLLREAGMSNLHILLTGRDTLFGARDAAFPEGSHLIRFQPFDREQVSAWSERWREATNLVFDGCRFLGSEKKSQGTTTNPADDLEQIASQPLMLYMLARMESEGVEISPQSEKGQKVEVYRRIVNWCCQRHEQLRPNDEWKAPQMRKFLRVAGFTAMARGRTAFHIDDLRAEIEAAGLGGQADPKRFLAERTILAFNFRSDTQQAWEFTHKSFGEYLAAEHLVSVCNSLTERFTDEFGQSQFRLDDAQSVRAWLNAFGPALIPGEVEGSLAIMLASRQDLHDRLSQIFVRLLNEEQPEEMIRIARRWGNRPSKVRGIAIANLFIVAAVSKSEVPLRFAPETAAPDGFTEAYDAVAGLLSNELEHGRIFSRVSASAALEIPFGAQLPRIEFFGERSPLPSQLNQVGLWRASFKQTSGSFDAMRSSFGTANFESAFAPASRFYQCAFGSANFRYADFSESNFEKSNLQSADLSNAILRKCRFQDCDLEGANLEGADLRQADFRGANLKDARFTNAQMEGCLGLPESVARKGSEEPNPRRRKKRPT